MIFEGSERLGREGGIQFQAVGPHGQDCSSGTVRGLKARFQTLAESTLRLWPEPIDQVTPFLEPLGGAAVEETDHLCSRADWLELAQDVSDPFMVQRRCPFRPDGHGEARLDLPGLRILQEDEDGLACRCQCGPSSQGDYPVMAPWQPEPLPAVQP